ncbi:BTAD domain-containing putative transcriptional regulator [Streptomyces sp. A012304]|uniref:BTAD domain-containing putative transcriptional regulator n=1 Tax=Streptomyces sp. A012304 TaxID=375446 RepID=UPI0022304B26|nr:BTAD domain-containing putative transcriptional regulator [Streptomyces sp. A012304]GKQ40338.1 AfsR family transcriptional regulator [Streptomyces sp. A012304]
MRYRILGVAQAEDGPGTPIPIPGPRLRALLTVLALRPDRPTPTATLIDEVWADTPPHDAPAALQALIGRLRRALGKDTVLSSPGGYRLAAAEEDIDLFVFERLVREARTALEEGDADTAVHTLDAALDLWRGPALADLPDRTAAARPEALHLEAARSRAEADLLRGRARDAVPRLTELISAHPYDEQLHVLLIRALRDTGRDADALAAYEAARRTLAEGLGTDPGPHLRALHTELLNPTLLNPTPAPPSPSPRPPLAPRLPEPKGNIRPRLTSFVGREPELAAIRSDLHRARLVTLIGPGGSGKTRLAEEAAAGLPQAWLVELAPLDRPEAVPGAVVSALGLRETVLMTTELAAPQDDPVALLVEYCAPRSQLLILDNCEHLIGAAATLAETLLTRCPGLTILATSREPLGVPGESVRPVDPLRPDQAHRLFADRAAAVRPDAAAVLQDEKAVAEICRRLDGLPLAIELAAARLRLLTPRQIADRLDDRFHLLTSGSRTALPRQQTLRAVVDWSWDLLDEPERTVLRELSVFAGGWSLEAAEAVCTGPVADLLGALVDKSLVVAGPCERTGGMRYRMLETIHEYATERAAEVPEARASADRRHRAWARALVERADPLLRSAEQLPWISRLETELDNIRVAIHRAHAAGDEDQATALCLAMGWFWWLRNYRHEGAEWTDRTLRLSAALDTLRTTPATLPTPSGTQTGTTTDSPQETPDTPTAVSSVSPTLTCRSLTVPADLTARMAAVDPVDAFLAAPDGEESHPRHTQRMNLRMLHLFLLSESEPKDLAADPRYRDYLIRLRGRYEPGGREAALMPGLIWPVTAFQLRDTVDVRAVLDTAVANCRAYGGEWELGCILMFRTHMVVDSPGGMTGVDDALAELRVISRRVGDRWMRAQVCSAAGEAEMARGRLTEAEREYREALRLAHEVGAHAESPFLIARLAEIAYRSGDVDAALAALDEATAVADRYGVADARAFVLLLRAYIALYTKDVARARELYGATREEALRGTPPPQFTAGLSMLDAQLTATESGPEHGLPMVADTLRRAVADECPEAIISAIMDGAAVLVAELGDLPRATRLRAVAERLRGPYPTMTPPHAPAEHTDAAARAALGAERHAAERARGAALTVTGALRELTEAVHAHPAHPAHRAPAARPTTNR